MNRRTFVLAGAALALVGCAPAAVGAAPAFQPTRFSVQVRGTGPDVLLIPGLTSGREVWNATVRAVPGYRYHLIQVAGFAGEPARGNAEGAVVAPLAEEIARYIEENRLGRPAIVGHSMGGTLAMMIAARRPAAAGRVMVVDMLPQPAGLFGGSAADMGPLASRLRNMIGTPGGRQLFASFMSAFSPPEAANRRSDPDVVGRAMHDLAGLDLAPQLPRIRAPLTIVYGSPDPQARAAVDRTFAAAFAPARGARLVRIDGSGHMVMLDQPARFQAALRAFLAD
ncbi:MAG TPA: alpha/beta hydrolase [Allosphingosinicella sp.]|nr:alpha/beta hydrolase [Allosphingosinicella sp.]